MHLGLWVVDKNFLENPELEEFFLLHPDNKVVLTEFAAIEGYSGGNPLKNICRSMAILAKHPRQVLVLKPFAQIFKLGQIDPNLRFDLVDWNQSRGFGEFCGMLKRAEAGESGPLEQVKKLSAAATAHLNLVEGNMDGLRPYIEHVRRIAGPELLRAWRDVKPMPGAKGMRVLELIADLANFMFRNDKSVPKITGTLSWMDARNFLSFRCAASAVLLALRWAEQGGAKDVKAAKLRNDFLDMTYAAAATYFDGVWSDDKKLTDVYLETSVLIDNVLAGKKAN